MKGADSPSFLASLIINFFYNLFHSDYVQEFMASEDIELQCPTGQPKDPYTESRHEHWKQLPQRLASTFDKFKQFWDMNRKVRTRSQIPVVGVTGHVPGWPGALKLPGPAV